MLLRTPKLVRYPLVDVVSYDSKTSSKATARWTAGSICTLSCRKSHLWYQSLTVRQIDKKCVNWLWESREHLEPAWFSRSIYWQLDCRLFGTRSYLLQTLPIGASNRAHLSLLINPVIFFPASEPRRRTRPLPLDFVHCGSASLEIVLLLSPNLTGRTHQQKTSSSKQPKKLSSGGSWN